MDGHYISIVSNAITNEDGTQKEVLKCWPLELRRVFEPIHSGRNNIAPLQQWNLKYSHTDVILNLRTQNGPSIHLEALSLLVDMSSVSFLAMPADVSTRGTNPGQSSVQNQNRLKSFVCWLFPEIQLSNKYENHAISRERTTEYSQRQQRRFQQQVPIVHAEELFSDDGEEDGEADSVG